MTVKNPKDIKEFLQAAFISAGLDATKASEIVTPVAEKCDEYYNWRPYGGATSFDDVDSQKAINEYTYQVDMATGALRAIIENILESAELADNASKVAAMTKAVNDFGTRVTAMNIEPNQEAKSIVDKIKKLIGIDVDPTELSPDEKERVEALDDLNEKILGQLPARAFKIYTDPDGNPRWIAFSSNAFEDLEKELFTTKALEEAVEYADKNDDRGPLLLYHVPSAIVGQCDFQGVQGRVLVESGIFNDSDLGRKALDYFKDTKEDYQVSIGFTYLAGDELDGVYDWLRINERSVCPFGTAANPWTAFNLIGDNPMQASKITFMEKVFGADLAASVIATADEATKALEASTKFKAKMEPYEDDDEDEDKKKKEAAEAAGKDTVEGTPAAKDATVVVPTETVPVVVDETVKEDKAVEFGPEQLQALAEHIALLTTAVEAVPAMQKALVELGEKVTNITKSQDERMGEVMQPAWTLPGLNRPSMSDKTAVTPEDAVKLGIDTKAGEEVEISPDPARAYVNDLLNIRA